MAGCGFVFVLNTGIVVQNRPAVSGAIFDRIKIEVLNKNEPVALLQKGDKDD